MVEQRMDNAAQVPDKFCRFITGFFANLPGGGFSHILAFFDAADNKSPPISFLPFEAKVFVLGPVLHNRNDGIPFFEKQARANPVYVVGLHEQRLNDFHNGQFVFFSEFPVPLVVGGHRHNRTRAVAGEHVIRNPDGNFFLCRGIYR